MGVRVVGGTVGGCGGLRGTAGGAVGGWPFPQERSIAMGIVSGGRARPEERGLGGETSLVLPNLDSVTSAATTGGCFR